MSNNPSFVNNNIRRDVKRTRGRAFKLSNNLYEKTSESQDVPRCLSRLLARKSAESNEQDENQSSPIQHQATAPRVQQPQESFQRLQQPHESFLRVQQPTGHFQRCNSPTLRVQQRSTAPPKVPASTPRVQQRTTAPPKEVPKVQETRMRTQVQFSHS
jgi:hypothetical protein